MPGRYPDNHRVRPTSRMILHHLGGPTLRIGNLTDPPTVRINRGAPLRLLGPLATGIGRTRRPQT
ncbi:hypothetical protein CRV15_28465 (plasmid) [Streptomyces clavuligerus]|nr:hypothetical protein CRV15_28465 [Streptomyces clavuligerus]